MKRNWWIIGAGVLIGAVAGWYYWWSAGCTSGSCAITGHPVNSTLYGALMGGLVTSTLGDLLPERKPSKQ
ncbi:MAG TPA: hypothetical protein PK760_02220 [Flavobacteriales bacterium]|nr:hypothetical protein [Flavobacteriales bacterium]